MYVTLASICCGSCRSAPRLHCCVYGHTVSVGIDVMFKGKVSERPSGAVPMLLHPAGFNCVMSRTNGAPPSRDPVLPSSAVPCSKNMPYPPRTTVCCPMDQAKPMRGAGLTAWMLMHPDGVLFFPHCT